MLRLMRAALSGFLGVWLHGFVTAQPTSSYQIIQEHIFDRYCITGHQEGTAFARQSDLVLTADVSYAQLIDVPPRNSAAREDGLVRVSSEGLPGLYKSFLWEKLNAPDQEHFYSDHPFYGSMMPLGGPPLTNGELEFIRRWIIAGAPDTGAVVDPAVLEDTTRYEPPEFVALDPPERGIQFHLGPFEVPPNFDREFFYYEPAVSTEDLYVKRIEISMRPGSHHFILYTFHDGTPSYIFDTFVRPRVYRDIRNEDGSYITANLIPMQFHEFFAGTQWPLLNYHFPPGVALRLPAGKGFDLNSHYANRRDQPIQGEIYVNLHLADRSEVVKIANILFLNNMDINLPPRQITTLSRVFTTDRRIHIFQLFSHAHEHMIEFRVEVVGGPRDGELVYISYSWEHPPILEIDPPLTLEPGQGLKLIATYNNWTDRTITFGLLSSDEMMILFGYYYTDDLPTGVESASPVPEGGHLVLKNYPNPFNPATTFELFLPEPGELLLAIYDIRGRKVAEVARGFYAAGTHRMVWEAGNLAAGVYFARLSSGGRMEVRKIVLMR